MFFVTKLGPKICIAVRDLARHMSNPGDSHWKALGRLIGYMKGIKLKGLRMKKPHSLRNGSLCDSDFAKDPITRKSVGGEIHTLVGCITAFSSRGEKSISKSTAEFPDQVFRNFDMFSSRTHLLILYHKLASFVILQ